jgi:hypothetical protein
MGETINDAVHGYNACIDWLSNCLQASCSVAEMGEWNFHRDVHYMVGRYLHILSGVDSAHGGLAVMWVQLHFDAFQYCNAFSHVPCTVHIS